MIALIHSGNNSETCQYDILFGGTMQKTMPLQASGGGAGDKHILNGLVKYSKQETSATTISVDVSATTGDGTWYVVGFRVYGVI